MEHLQGRVAVVTGAASGLGLAMSNRFAEAEMKVVLADIEADPLDAAVRELRAAGHDATGVVTDAPAGSRCRQPPRRGRFRCPWRVHVLCNNAGVVKRARVWELTLDDWNWVLGVDFWSVVYGLGAFVPHAARAEGGHIVNTSSMAGLLPMPNLARTRRRSPPFSRCRYLCRPSSTSSGSSLECGALSRVHCHRHHEDGARSSRRPGRRGAAAARPRDRRRGRDADGGGCRRAGSRGDHLNRFWILTHDQYRTVIGSTRPVSARTPGRRRRRSGERGRMS